MAMTEQLCSATVILLHTRARGVGCCCPVTEWDEGCGEG